MRATEKLAQQHREVEQLFGQLERGSGAQRTRLLGKLAECLTLHAALEERFFYALARECGLEEQVNDALEEHQEVKRLVSELVGCAQHDPRIHELLARLRQGVSRHVDEEERMVFPWVEEHAARGQLEQVGAEMERSEQALREQELLKLAESQASLTS